MSPVIMAVTRTIAWWSMITQMPYAYQRCMNNEPDYFKCAKCVVWSYAGNKSGEHLAYVSRGVWETLLKSWGSWWILGLVIGDGWACWASGARGEWMCMYNGGGYDGMDCLNTGEAIHEIWVIGVDLGGLVGLVIGGGPEESELVWASWWIWSCFFFASFGNFPFFSIFLNFIW